MVIELLQESRNKPLLHFFSPCGELITRRGSIIGRLFALGVIISFPVIFSPRSKEARSATDLSREIARLRPNYKPKPR